MIICSWDVGITHLAYCIMEYKPENNKIKFPIYGWRNINLINKKPLLCNQPLKKKNKSAKQTYCQKNAKYVVTIDNKEVGYCGAHKKNYINNVNENNSNTFFINADKNKSCCSKKKDNTNCSKKPSYYRLDEKTCDKIYYCTVHKKKYDLDNGGEEYKLVKGSDFDKEYTCVYKNCSKNATYYFEIDDKQTFCTVHKKKMEKDKKGEYSPIKNIKIIQKCDNINKNKKKCDKNAIYFKKTESEIKFYCSFHKNSLLLKEKEDSVLQLVKKKKANKVSIDHVLKQLMIKLDEIPELLQVDKVIIENQPSLKNPKMKTVSSALYTYFLLRGIVDKDKNESKIKDINFMSPSNKLKVDQDNTLKVLSNADNGDKKYKLTKSLGIKYCKQLIQHDKDSIKLLEQITQKDKPDDLCDAMLQGAYYLSIRCKQPSKKKKPETT